MKKINLKKVFRGRNIAFSLLIFAVIFLVGNQASANWAGNVVGGIIGLFIRAVAYILILLVGVLMDVASYSDFIHAAAVAKGWIVVRDLCNMFFVVILLIIAFATILGQEEYGAKKMLPKLIMAAVLINFSKMFCGLMLDVASVVMLTFVNAFSAIGAGNILDLLGISKITKISTESGVVDFSTIVSYYIFGLIYVLIATVVVASMLGMLVMRIVMIWILVVLSPLAFFLQAVPGKGQQYASQWWTKWSSNLIVGPVIAFFLWLSFASLQADVSPIAVSGRADIENSALNADVSTVATSTNGLGSEAGTTASMAKFVIAIGMLLGGMKIAQEVGGETGAALGKGMAQINKGRALAVGAATGLAVGAAKGTAKLAGRSTLGLVSQIDKGLSGSQGGERKTWAGKLAKGWGDDLQASSKKNRKAAAAKYLGKLGMGEKTALAGQQVVSSRGFQTTANIIKGGAIGAAVGTAVGPVGTIVGLLSGIAAGYAGSARKGNAIENVKKYEGVRNEYEKSNAEYDDNKNFVKKYDDYEKDATALETAQRGGAVLSREEQKELKTKRDFVLKADNIDKHDSAKKYVVDPAVISSLSTKKANLDALNKNQYDKDKKITTGTGAMGTILKSFDRFSDTKAAWADMTKDQADAKIWVKNAAANTDTLATSGKPGNIYSSSGLSKNWKNRLDVLNKGGGDADQALTNLIDEIKSPNTDSVKLVELAKAISAYEGGGVSLDSATLGKLKGELANMGEDPAKFTTTRQYKNYDENLMEHKPGTGNLSYETFAKNATKHEAGKDIMDVSFAKLNEKLPADFKLKDEASVNEASGEQLKAISTAMSGLIDNEIKVLQSVPNAAINSDKIKQLNTAKSRLITGDVQNLSLNNSDMTAKGANDSERRRNGYNNRQHEIMHSAGATNEAAVYESSDALQSAKLVGRIPGAGGERYDVAMGKMIAEMEKAQASQEDMSQAITNQVEKWKVPNAQRVIETEKGERETVSDTSQAISSLNETIKKLKTSGGGGVQGKTVIDYSVATKDFMRKSLKPLATIAAKKEIGTNA